MPCCPFPYLLSSQMSSANHPSKSKCYNPILSHMDTSFNNAENIALLVPWRLVIITVLRKALCGVLCAVWDKAVMAVCCRYLALVAALTSEADYVFIPENPPPENWGEKICSKLKQARTTNLYAFISLSPLMCALGLFQACFPDFIPDSSVNLFYLVVNFQVSPQFSS